MCVGRRLRVLSLAALLSMAPGEDAATDESEIESDEQHPPVSSQGPRPMRIKKLCLAASDLETGIILVSARGQLLQLSLI